MGKLSCSVIVTGFCICCVGETVSPRITSLYWSLGILLAEDMTMQPFPEVPSLSPKYTSTAVDATFMCDKQVSESGRYTDEANISPQNKGSILRMRLTTHRRGL